MAKAKKLVLPKEWWTFANRYGADRPYWYVPKGLAVTAAALKPRLKVLKEFEHGKAWRDCQQAYIQRLNEKGISDAEAEWDGGGAPLARMLKQVFVMLGLAWVDLDDRVEITPAGDKLLTDKDPDGVLSDQMSRYQFTNPTSPPRRRDRVPDAPPGFDLRKVPATDRFDLGWNRIDGPNLDRGRPSTSPPRTAAHTNQHNARLELLVGREPWWRPEWLPADALDDAYFRLLPSGQSAVTAEEARARSGVLRGWRTARAPGGHIDMEH
jgi:hypothetical protein